ncbi:MAG TPA: Trm112 family protein [Jatrophihabitantaceae bacterium]|nr:Trm112 family protein [Jatrophihabitantaceae bacterium]
MTLDADLLALLACPSDDHGPLREETVDGAETLVCTVCLSRFPIQDGIPVLLRDDATPGPNGLGVPASG